MTDYQINIKNCNSIKQATIQIRGGRLNLKYGPNGIGKSTIARAIVSQARNDGTLSNLIPFKNRGKEGAEHPTVEGAEDFHSALVFDEEYISQFVFQPDEVVKSSFDIFIRTDEYEAAMTEIEALLSGIKKAFADNAEIEQATRDLKDLRDAFGKANKDGSIPKSSKLLKAFGLGNKIDNVPDSLQPYELFIKSKNPSKWIGWQIKGNEFLELGDICPYCSASMSEPTRRETARAVANEYDATAIGHLNTLKEVIERLGKYFSAACRDNLEKVTGGKVELTAPQKGFFGRT